MWTALSCRGKCAPRSARSGLVLRDSAILSPGVRAATGKVQASQLHFLLFLRFPAEGGGFCSAGTAGGAERAQGAAESRRGSGARDRSRGHGEWGARRRRGLSGGAGDALWRARWGAREKRAVIPGVLRRENLDFKRMVPLFRIPAKNPQMQKGPAIHRDCGPFYTVPLLKPPLQSRRPSPEGKSRGAGKARAARRSPLSGRPPFCGHGPGTRRFFIGWRNQRLSR